MPDLPRSQAGDGAQQPPEVSRSHPVPVRRAATILTRPFPARRPLRQILPLRGAIQNYPWGSRTALADLLGRPGPSEQPEAELWLGAHPNGPSEVQAEGAWERLDALLERESGHGLLGTGSLAAFGRRLPFLLKVLAVERPLSLQVHPDAEQARSGFARQQEGAGGAPRLYADAWPKPELICAITPFTALCGFRPLSEVRAAFAAHGIGALVPLGDDEPAVLSALVGGWLTAPQAERAAVLERALEHASATAADPASAVLLTLAEAYPGDPGVLAPLLLHHVELAPGEALFLPPGELHCYLRGVAVELMASSDNVLRGGLTPKAVHVGEMLRIARFRSRRPPRLRAAPRAPGVDVWRTEAEEFELSLLAPGPSGAVAIDARAGIEVLWCAEGELHVRCASGAGIRLARGASCLVPASVGPYRVEGEGRAFRAGLPER